MTWKAIVGFVLAVVNTLCFSHILANIETLNTPSLRAAFIIPIIIVYVAAFIICAMDDGEEL